MGEYEMYDYKLEKPKIYTDDGIKALFKINKRINALLETSGSFTIEKAIHAMVGSNWFHLALVEYLAEIGEIVEITNPDKVTTQNRIFVRNL